jgi:uncharacterized protein (TIGR03437 family)
VFTLNSTTTPAFDGQFVVFRDIGSADDASLQAIWSFDTTTAKFTKLADLHTVMPGGTATFTDLHLSDTAPTVRNGTVIFLGRSTAAGQYLEGLYSVPATGGAITAVVDYRYVDPSGGAFSLFDSGGKQMGGFSFDGATVAFHGQGTTQTTGIYTARPDGSFLAMVADSPHAFSFSGQTGLRTFLYPMISGTNVVLTGTDGADPGTGYNGLYLKMSRGTETFAELVNSTQSLPGDPSAATHLRFDAPVDGFDGTKVAFRATNAAASAPFYGLYWTDLASHVINKIADVNTTLAGLGSLRAIADAGLAVNQGNVLYRAADITTGYPGNSALYLWANGVSTRIVGTGDMVNGKAAQVVHDPGPAALSGANFAFTLEFSQYNGFAIYYAAATLGNSSTASYAPFAPLAPGSIASAFGQAMADTAASSAPPLPTTLANVALSVTDSAGATRPASLYFAGPTQINYVVPDATALGAATVTVAKNGLPVASGAIQVATVAPGLFAANGNGTGPAAAVAVKFPASGASTWQNAATCAAAGNCVTAPIDLGAAGDRVYLELFGTGIRGYRTGITVTIGGTAALAPAFGAQPQFPGMDQVNVLIPRSLIGSGDVDVVLTVDGVAANTVKINIK